MTDEILTRWARLANRSRGRDVIGRDAVAQEAEHARAADVAHRCGLDRHAVEVRCSADVSGRWFPREAIALGNWQAAPALVAVEHLCVALAEHRQIGRAHV